MFIQNSAVVLKNAASRTAVSPVMPRCLLIIAVIRFAGTPIDLASILALIGGTDGFMKSSDRISPGWMCRMPFLIIAWFPSVIIGDLNIMRPVRHPHKTNPPLIIDPDAVLPFNSSSRFPGSERRSLMSAALSNIVSFCSTAFRKLENSLTISPEKNRSVFLSRNDLIIVTIIWFTSYVTRMR